MENKIKVWFEKNHIFIKMPSGEQKNHPLSWFPKLLNASDEERIDFSISPFGIHWQKIDEDLSFEGFSSFKK
ncbi:DUF2442 domain-containing protein [Pedobacter rhodius]|uniref:DUF2442 domain-containing protein n=1 Tax=Pedobacter rhodius TaxID=3004098 RepID=A0ABT4L012_9SPHI|nr:DUF2442 domain-containing protein [Pedobacter sp. SJ11]MCZ4224459.1 DUF2442 domain-containing protein [Pedobacter sp. SJ11]